MIRYDFKPASIDAGKQGILGQFEIKRNLSWRHADRISRKWLSNFLETDVKTTTVRLPHNEPGRSINFEGTLCIHLQKS